ncbi:unnamed protein product [Gongylonema pulchrum]|uniref:TLC domain-containing protein n=1 Tax=Gongylonema pulchrum TaxID=637853 RepID=A0A183EGY8_9BILA|nr:unnamed protein product [Gongylonema pulchrum]
MFALVVSIEWQQSGWALVVVHWYENRPVGKSQKVNCVRFVRISPLAIIMVWRAVMDVRHFSVVRLCQNIPLYVSIKETAMLTKTFAVPVGIVVSTNVLLWEWMRKQFKMIAIESGQPRK